MFHGPVKHASVSASSTQRLQPPESPALG
jgi:hypothetical protein